MAANQPRKKIIQYQYQQSAVNDYENALFVSYAWGGESEKYVDALESNFMKCGISMVRDKKDLEYRGSIETFEQRIGMGQCVVLVISDKYLRSEHCMDELLKLNENRNLRERIFPIVLDDASIYRPIDRLSYIKYWDDQIEKLNQAIKGVKVMTSLASVIAALEKYARIRDSFDYLTDLLSDMNALTSDAHVDDCFSTLNSAIEKAMDKNQMSSKSVQAIDTDRKSWEEFAASLPKSANDTEKLMTAMYYHFETGNAEVVEMKTITNNYFRRARWSRPVNLSATANYCASKGWLSEVGRTKSQKLWKITKSGYETIKDKMSQ